MSNIVVLSTRKPPPAEVPPLDVVDYSIAVGDGIYHVHRATNDGKGFVTIRNAIGETILVRSARLPDEFIVDVIMGWREGRKSATGKAMQAAERMLSELSHGRGEI